MNPHKTAIFSLTLLFFFFTLAAVPMQSIASNNSNYLNATESADFNGVWRGLLEVQKGVTLPLGININDDHTRLTIDSPHQNMFARTPTRFEITGNKVSFEDEGLKASFEGTLEQGQLTGTFTQGRAMPLVLSKLDADDKARMVYEGSYSGELKINASSTLPLVLHISVQKGAYTAALDSPAQNSFGIPISEVEIDENSLSFKSPMLSASFKGSKEANENSSLAYAGTFVQGLAMPLTLTKVTDENAAVQYQNPAFGEHGGAIAIVSNGQVQMRSFGSHNKQTQYEIGSVTKTLTAYLLAKQVQQGDISLSSSLSEFFPDAPNVDLQSLATHTSGLPRLPPSLSASANVNDPYASTTRASLSEDLKNITAGKPEYEYSNFAYGALAEALALNANSTYAEQAEAHIFAPLNMQNSYVAVKSSDKQAHLAEGFNMMGEVVSPWYFGAISGAGAVVATLPDTVKYLQHMMAIAKQKSDLATLLFTVAKPPHALGWVVSEDSAGKSFIWHNGMTAGFSSFVGFYADGSRGVALLNNQAVSIDELGIKLLSAADFDIQSI